MRTIVCFCNESGLIERMRLKLTGKRESVVLLIEERELLCVGRGRRLKGEEGSRSSKVEIHKTATKRLLSRNAAFDQIKIEGTRRRTTKKEPTNNAKGTIPSILTTGTLRSRVVRYQASAIIYDLLTAA